MASAANPSRPQSFACKCLNVRLTSANPSSSDSNDTTFFRIYVGEDGIQVAHPQLTLRVKSRGEIISGSTRSRFTTLKCLICDLLVYRVHQVISSEVEANDLPLVPSNVWAEQEIMKSLSGWIEVHKDCLGNEAIARTASSKEYSNLFSLVLPSPSDKTPASSANRIYPQSAAPIETTPAIPESYLTQLPPLLPPPPFTPSHPVFLHILSIAEQGSQNIRAAANEELTRIVRAKVAEVQEKEAELREQLERIWLKFKSGTEKIQQERPPSSTVTWSSPVTNNHRSSGVRAPVCIPGFEPVSITAPPQITLPPQTTLPPPRKSWLSQSIAKSSHLHQAMVNKTLPTNSSEGMSVRSESLTLVPNSADERESISVLQFRRRVDETINTTASYQYFRSIENELPRRRQERASESAPDHNETMGMPAPSPLAANGGSLAAANGTNGNAKGKDKEDTRIKSKDKHVRFVQNSTKQTRDSSSRKSQGSNKSDSGEMVFDLDDDMGAKTQPREVQPPLPLLDPPVAHQRERKTKPQHTVGLPASFSALRPASLPAPSHMRSGRFSNHEAYSHNIMSALPPSEPISRIDGENKEDTTDQETSEETTDSSPRPTSDSDTDSEDYGERCHHSQFGFSRSLPINVVPPNRHREVLSLASYQQKPIAEGSHEASIVAPPSGVGAMAPKKKMASVARKSSYVERSRSRFLDLGNLDFVAEVDEEDEEEQKEKKVLSQSVDGERGRHHAFKILQARAELPEEGMWRSLAS